MSNKKKWLYLPLITLGVLFLLVFAFVYRSLTGPIYVANDRTSILVKRGAQIHTIANELNKRGLYRQPRLLRWYARITGQGNSLQYGDYLIKSGMSVIELLRNITNGTGQKLHYITFIEGWTFRDMKKAIDDDAELNHTIKNKTDAEIMAELGYPKEHPEGRFFPDTYAFFWGSSDLSVLRKAHRKMQATIAELWPTRKPDLPYKTPYKALIVASLIEKETAVEKERRLIAGVIVNRLRQRIRLRVDPTVLYGLNKPFDTPITKKDLRSKTPYNTYVNYGLPPTPIDMPSLASIKAALNPANTEYLYYVSNGDGSHRFSRSYDQHLTAVKKYRVIEKDRNLEGEWLVHIIDFWHLYDRPWYHVAAQLLRVL